MISILFNVFSKVYSISNNKLSLKVAKSEKDSYQAKVICTWCENLEFFRNTNTKLIFSKEWHFKCFLLFASLYRKMINHN